MRRDGRLEERDPYLRFVVVRRLGRRGRRIRPVVHFRVGIGRGQVDHDGRRARVGLVTALLHGHDGRGTGGGGGGRPAVVRDRYRRGRGRRRVRGRRPVAAVAPGGSGRRVAPVEVQRDVARLAAARGGRSVTPLLHLHADQLVVVDRLADRVRRTLPLVFLQHTDPVRAGPG